ncbi:protein TolR [Sulfuriferula nivalis]|uniref:TolR-like protein n=1 Tax=Sulfuriferula nivalis TaxID=2675298 RepID=A0A809S830_9PROT|nr:protein TolR [Sulfuriferula nivalis]BBO99951.1 TolR-like protein [Sulfuriferula nivalis]
MSQRRPRKQMNNINVVPYIDVMLVLLVIFMVTAPMVNPGQVDLPSVAKTQTVALQPLQITIHANGELRVHDQAQANSDEQTVDNTELVNVIRQKQADHPDQAVVIAADKNVRYEDVMKIMSLMQQNQVKRVGLLAAMGDK